MMVTVLTVMLAVLLTAGLTAAIVVSFGRWRRRAVVARQAADWGFRYSPEDPFELTRRCAEFALVAAGHSPVAANVVSGHCEGFAVRAFDFQYEVGHGARRMSRRYGVVLLEMDSPPGRLSMWHNGDFAPIPARQEARTLGDWSVVGDAKLAEAFAAACESWFARGGCVEIAAHAALFAAPGLLGQNGFPPLPDLVKTVRPLLR